MICHTCCTVIPAGLAVQRSINFRPRVWCRDCWTARPTIPAQRRAVSEKVEA